MVELTYNIWQAGLNLSLREKLFHFGQGNFGVFVDGDRLLLVSHILSGFLLVIDPSEERALRILYSWLADKVTPKGKG